MTDHRHSSGPRANLPPSWVDPARDHDEERARMLRTAILQPSAELMALRTQTNGTSAGGPCLILQSGSARGTAIQLLPMSKETTSTWIIGCEANCDILLTETGVSAFHAIVAHTSGHWTLADQQSASGTFVNGKPCVKKVLKDGDQLQFGRVTSTLHIPKEYRAKIKINCLELLMRAVRAIMSLPRAILRRKRVV